jgi:hypothetical protein
MRAIVSGLQQRVTNGKPRRAMSPTSHLTRKATSQDFLHPKLGSEVFEVLVLFQTELVAAQGGAVSMPIQRAVALCKSSENAVEPEKANTEITCEAQFGLTETDASLVARRSL